MEKVTLISIEEKEGVGMEEKVEKLEERIEALEIRLAVVESNIQVINKTLDSIMSNTTWCLRLIIGVIVTAVLDIVIKGFF